LIKILEGGALAAGFSGELWTLPRIAPTIKERFEVDLSQPAVWRMLQQLGWSMQTGRSSTGARPRGDPRLETEAVSSDKKIAARQRRIIVFIDE